MKSIQVRWEPVIIKFYCSTPLDNYSQNERASSSCQNVNNSPWGVVLCTVVWTAVCILAERIIPSGIEHDTKLGLNRISLQLLQRVSRFTEFILCSEPTPAEIKRFETHVYQTGSGSGQCRHVLFSHYKAITLHDGNNFACTDGPVRWIASWQYQTFQVGRTGIRSGVVLLVCYERTS